MDGCDGKLRRAKEHLGVLDKQITHFQGLHKHTIFVEDDPRTSEYVFKVRGLQPSDPDWTYIAGDCIHNLRSALDHLVYQLAIVNLGRDLTNEDARSCMFPIYSDPNTFLTSGYRRIKLLRPSEQARITQLQPFNASDPSIWPTMPGYLPGTPHYIPTLLGQLESLEVIDKHRSTHATWRAAQWFDAKPPPIKLLGSTIFAGALENGAEVGRWHYSLPRPELSPDMDMDSHFPIGVALGEPPFMNGVVGQLAMHVGNVEAVLRLFRFCVAKGAPALPLVFPFA